MIVYTRPPYPHYMYSAETTYPYILVNVYSETEVFRYVNRRSSRFIKSVLLDSGVHSVFHTQKLQEYPGGYQNWIAKTVWLWRRTVSLIADSYAVVPDYPVAVVIWKCVKQLKDREIRIHMFGVMTKAWPEIAHFIVFFYT